MSKLFISHSSQDDAFVRELRWTLADLKQDAWIDSRELRGGDPLWPEIQKAIEDASSYAVLVSPAGLESKWVGKELRHALELRRQRGKDRFRVIPLSLNGTKLGVLEEFFGEEPVYIPVSSAAGGAEAAMNPLLVAMGLREPTDITPAPQPSAEPLEELVLELTDLSFHVQDGARRACAHATLVYQPATRGQREVQSAQDWLFIAPIGPIETGELRWYLEKYAIWPSQYFRNRAAKVEANLVEWGKLLHAAAIRPAYSTDVMNAWAKINAHAGRRFSVHVDPAVLAGAPEADLRATKEAATQILALPWELLHDGDSYLFQGAKPTRVRRRLPNTQNLDTAVVAAPIRVLLVTARPEDESCLYIDHRASALPLVDAMEALGGLVRIHVLSPPTLPALNEELKRAFRAKEPYHVVHFDGHGVYDKTVGLGGLCFEHPEDGGKLDERRHVTVFTDELGPILKEYRIPLVFLGACQTAQAEEASESVASDLLQRGVASVVAMSHSVLVETARRFVKNFYKALAEGKRVGDGMLAGQDELHTDKFRGRVFGVGELKLDDWFVPVLFQEKEDPQLFRNTPAPQTQEDLRTILNSRLGDLPKAPETGFIGRSRDLLALQRLLDGKGVTYVSENGGLGADGDLRYAVIRGQGGEGKTALAAEFARWMVRSQQVRRAAFVCVEGLEKNIAESVLDKLGGQLVKPGFSTQADCGGDVEKAEQEIARVLREQPTLLMIDNMESILLPPLVAEGTPEALTAEAREELKALLALCERLLRAGETRMVFTSREELPEPFDARRHRRELFQMDREDAVKLVERTLNAAGGDAGTSDAAREQIEQLVDAVHCHARTLTLLAPALRERGVDATRESLVELMAEMEKKFPGSREQSLFASVELSLRRMSAANRDRARVLGVFHGGVQLGVLRAMMQWEEADLASLAGELVGTGLATPNRYNHLTLNPALCPYLRGRLEDAEREALTARWVKAMRAYAGLLMRQQDQNAELAATLTVHELPNLFALLDLVERAGDPEATIDLATLLYSLLQVLGKPRLLERVGQVRDGAAPALGDAWNHARFDAAATRIQQRLAGGRMREAFDGAQRLFKRARAAGRQAYPGADYDLAHACWLLARVLYVRAGWEQALPLLAEARQRFQAVAKEHGSRAAERMAHVCFAEEGNCLRNMERLDEAAAVYEEAIHRDEQRGADRDVAVGKGQLGSIRMLQRRYPEALAAFEEARERFTQLHEPGSVALDWHHTGMVYKEAGQPEAAEDAYRKSLAISVPLGDVAGQARTLVGLGNLYLTALERPERAAAFYQQAADKYLEIGDATREGVVRTVLSETLRKLHRLDEARQEIHRAIECRPQSDHAIEPWKSWAILADIETDAGNPAVAAQAKRKAIDCYLAYRRDGGQNHDGPGRLAFDVTQSLRSGNAPEAAALLQRLADNPECPAWLLPFIRALQAIVAGSRDRSLADAPDLDYMMAGEILLLIESLETPR